MSIGRLLSWAVVVLTGFMPLNWIRLWITGEIPKDATIGQFFTGTLICWGIAAGLAYFLVISARGIKIRKAKEEQKLQELMAAPLSEIRPSKALLKSDEKAYGSVSASLQETTTVGYTSGTKGMSVRVAKGVTLRTSGTRARAVKGMVTVANGELVITNQRIIFAGDRKGFAISLDNLLNTTNYKDGFGFNDNKTTYTLTTNNEYDRMSFSIAMAKVLSGR